jgi:predicted TIM-barrel fold metal-dependent hydrolase
MNMNIEKIKEFEIIDTHTHMGRLAYLNIISGDDDSIVEILRSSGVSRAIFSHHGSLTTINTSSDLVFNTLKKYPDFLLGHLVYNPNHPEVSLRMIKENIFKPGIAGIKIHPSWHNTYPFDDSYKAFWEFTSENGIVVLTHSWNPNVANKAQKYSDPEFFEKVLKDYPSQKLILAHAGGRGEYFLKVLEILKRNKNFYVDFAGDSFPRGMIERYVNEIGSERILFGSDIPWIDVRYHISYILNSDISDQDRKNIFSSNAKRLFGLD